MFRKNQRHLQPSLMSDLDHLTEKQRQRLDESWAGTFRREVFARLDESPFAALYSDTASRPNIPVNVLVGLETLKAGHDWSDEDLHDAFSFDVQVRYALGYNNLGEGEFDLRTVYNFRRRLSEHQQATGENLLERAFAQVTEAQLDTFALKTHQLRMDTTQIASNIRQVCRLQLLVEILQRVQRSLSPADQERYAAAFAPYLQGSAGQYVYRLKGHATADALQGIGTLMQQLVNELRPVYADAPFYPLLERVFGEQFRLTPSQVEPLPGADIRASSLRSPDDPEATYRRKGTQAYQGYVTNVTETCAPENPFQLIVHVQTAPNTTEDATLLIEALPTLKARTGVATLYNDASFCSPAADVVLREQQVVQVPSDLRGHAPSPHRLGLADCRVQCDAVGEPVALTCPQEQTVTVQAGRKPHRYVADLDPLRCQRCALQSHCAAGAGSALRFSRAQLDLAQRRQRCAVYRQFGPNLRAAIEATIGAIKRPFSDDQLPVRGRRRVGELMLGSAWMVNVRRIQRYLAAQRHAKRAHAPAAPAEGSARTASPSFWTLCANRFWTVVAGSWRRPITFSFDC